MLSPKRQRSDQYPTPSLSPPPHDLSLPTPSSSRKPPSHPPSSASSLLPTPSLHPSLIPANVYVQQRSGSILSRSMIIKADSFSSSSSSSSTPPPTPLELHLLGAPNMQQIRPFYLFGVGQPTISGIRTLLNLVKARHPHSRHVRWTCLREEPILYVNNRPFVLRDIDAPFHNLSDLQGIEGGRVDGIERRLKEDVLAEAVQHDGNVLVHDEVVHGEVRACWESCEQGAVRTTREVFDVLRGEGYQVELTRVPMTAESVMDARQVDAVVASIVEEATHSTTLTSPSPSPTASPVPPSPHHLRGVAPSPLPSTSPDMLHIHVFNCQLGRGRSTMGLIIAFLLQCHILGYTPPPTPPPLDPSNADGLNAYRRGEWDVILKLSRLLRNGRTAKAIADAAVDACGRVHHIRLAIVSLYVKSEHARGEVQHRQLMEQTAAALKRYFFIVCFASYLQDLPQALTPAFLAHHSFHAFLTAHRELTTLANSFIQGDTVDELLSTPSASPSSSSLDTSSAADECSSIDRAVFARGGAVLGQRCIVKSEYFSHKGEVGQYRGVFDLPLGSTAQPNVAGIRKIIRAITDSRPSPPPHLLRLVWINLREEPVVFLSGEPYLLRDYLHPFRILAEFTTGMTPARSEQIEERLKGDILSELSASAPPPHLLVHDETVYRQIRAREVAVDAAAVQTTAEVFAAMAKEAEVELRYHRIPMHVEEVVGIASFDRLFSILSAEDLGDDGGGEGGGGGVGRVSVVFHDQKGGRRVAMGLVIACLIMMYKGGVDLRMMDPATDAEDQTAEPMSPSPVPLPSSLTASPATSPRPPPPPTAETTLHTQPAGPAYFAPPEKISSPNQPTPPTPSSSSSSSPFPPLPPPPPPSLHRAKSVITLDPSTKTAELTSTGRGEYKGILSLIRILKRGRAAKEEVDLAIDVAGSAYNVRDAIAEALTQHERERTGGVQRGPLMEAVKHAESYAMLIVFNAYLRERKEKEDEDRASSALATPHPDAAEEGGSGGGHPSPSSSDGDAAQQADVIAREKAAEASAHAAVQTRLEKDQEIDAAQITSYDLFNPYIAGSGYKESDSLAPHDDDGDDRLIRDLKQKPSTSPTSPTRSSPTHHTPASSRTLTTTATPSLPRFPTFSSWLHSRPELRLALEFIHREPEEAFRLNATVLNEEFAAAYDRRRGNVLVRGSLIKSDHFAGVMNKAVVQLVEGAVNFRPVEGFPVAGTGIPKAEGIGNILHFFSAGEAAVDEEGRVVATPLFRAESLLWLNLREEPIVYVNHRPFVLRDGDNPYANLENTGITPRRVEAMEKQLKIDAWREVQEGGEGTLLLHDEDDNGNLIQYLEPVTLDSLQTPKEEFYSVFAQLEEHWREARPALPFTAQYFRTPITDEQAPSPAALDAMIRYLEQGREEQRRVIVINCVEEGTLVALVDGTSVPIEEVQEGMEVLSYHAAVLPGEKAGLSARQVDGVLDRGHRQCVELLFSDGRTLVCTPDHRIRTADGGWVAAGDLEVDTAEVAVHRSVVQVTYGVHRDDRVLPLFRVRLVGRLEVGLRHVYDLSVPNPQSEDDRSFVANGLVVHNCQMGRGRTTTGLIIACLWCLHRGIVSKDAWTALQMQNPPPPHPPIPDTPGLSPALASSLRAGWYRLISSLMRVLPHGQALKAQVDAVIDHCSAMQNLRSVIVDLQVSAMTCLPKKRPFFVRRGTNYLLRYAVLIIINAYLTEVGESEGGYEGKAFVSWLNERPEIMSLLRKVEFPQTVAQRA